MQHGLRHRQRAVTDLDAQQLFGLWIGGVSNVDIDGNNAFQIKAIGVVISAFETLPAIEGVFLDRIDQGLKPPFSQG